MKWMGQKIHKINSSLKTLPMTVTEDRNSNLTQENRELKNKDGVRNNLRRCQS